MASLDIRDESRGDVAPFISETAVSEDRVVLSVFSDIDIASMSEFRAALSSALAHGKPVTLDLAQCNYLDSTGISTLVSAKNANHEIAIVASRHVAKIFDLVGLTQYLKVTPAA